MLSEFKAFIAGGNVLSLAVGVLIGAAFGTIVASMTEDIIMPIVGALFGGMDFSNFYFPLASVPTGTASTLEAVRAANLPDCEGRQPHHAASAGRPNWPKRGRPADRNSRRAAQALIVTELTD
jgi:hypothetical protein